MMSIINCARRKALKKDILEINLSQMITWFLETLKVNALDVTKYSNALEMVQKLENMN